MHRLIFFLLFFCSVLGHAAEDTYFPQSNMPGPADCQLTVPVIQCITSDASGAVTISWTQSSDPNGAFLQYGIFSVQNGLLATVPSIATTSYTIPIVGQQNDYFIALMYDCNGIDTVYSDTLSNVFLDVTNPSDGTAVLHWNEPQVNPGATMSAYCHILREYPTGNWQVIDSVPYGVHFYKDTIDICEAFLRYQIVFGNEPCDYISNLDGDNFQDLLTPDIPLIQTVSIDTLTNEVHINWNQNYQPDTYGYVIYTFNPNGFLYELDTLWGIGNTSYVHATDITQGPLSYSVAAFDSCQTQAIPSTFQTSAKATVNTSVFLESTLHICANLVDLNWSEYVGWDSIARYEIWSQKDGQNWVVLDSTLTSNYTVSVEGLKDYCFFIKVVSENGAVSFSNKTCLSIIAPTQTAFHYLQLATVNSEQVDLKHLVDFSGGVKAIAFERMNKQGVFEELIQVPVTSNVVTYTDQDVDVSKHRYIYRARIVDSCGQYGITSNTAQTILLTIQKDEIQQKTYLNWNEYQQFNGHVLGYNLYRSIDDGFPEIHASLTGDQLSFQDDLSEVNFKGKVCYHVEAVEGDNAYNDPQVSRSNTVCDDFQPIIYIPNAFIPDGVNDTFIPVLSNFDPADYQFTIFDRLGQVIFETNDPTSGWNGIIPTSGKQAEVATYIYRVKMHDGNGVELVKRGHVTLLR